MISFCPWAVVLVLLGHECAAKPDDEQPKKVKVTVVVILAGETEGKIDPRLKWIAQEVQKKDASLKSFRLKSMTCRSLAVEEKAAFDLVDDKSAGVVVKRPADSKNRVELAIKAPDQVGLVYQSACGKFLPIITSYRTVNRERLILAVRVQPCKE